MTSTSSTVRITKSAYETLLEIGRFPPEVGAVIGETPEIISNVFFDVRAGIGNAVYQPTAIDVETTVAMWQKSDIEFLGFCHSHHNIASPALSTRDVLSAQKIMIINNMTHMVLGVLYHEQVFMYCIHNSEAATPAIEPLEVIIV